jgi:hypothetical protein
MTVCVHPRPDVQIVQLTAGKQPWASWRAAHDQRMPGRLASLALALTLVLACTAPSATPTPTAPAPPTGGPAAPTGTATAAPTSTPQPTPADLAKRPLVWYSPLPPMPGRTGSVDFMDQFTDAAPWGTAAGYVDVYKLYGEWVAYHASDDQLRAAVTDIVRRDQVLAVEAGPSEPRADCSSGVESFAGIEEGRLIADRVIGAGGRIAVLALDEPYFFGHLYDGPNACHLPVDEIAEGVASFVSQMRLIFPELIVGDIESNTNPVTADGMAEWLDAYEAAAGEKFAFIQLDVDWARPNWIELSHDIQQRSLARGVPFGMLYNGGYAPQPEQWVKLTGQRIRDFDAAGDPADHTVLQSWFPQPDHALPESDPNTFSGLLKAYVEAYDGLGGSSGGAGANAALGRPVTASGKLAGFGPSQAVDGDFDAPWNAGDGPVQWIEIAFDGTTDVTEIRLTVAQSPAGPTVHRVLGRTAGGDLAQLHRFEGVTQDLQVLNYAPATPWQDLRAIRIETRESPSWVAWREIEVFAP